MRDDAEHRGTRRRRRPRSSYDEDYRPRVRTGRGSLGDPEAFRSRGFHILLAFAAICAIVVCRLVWLQVIAGPGLAQQASERRTNSITLHAKRGTIYDRNGNVLAMSEDCETLYCNPQQIGGDASKAASILADKLGGKASSYRKALEGDGTFAYVKRQADTDDADAALEALSDAGIEGVYALADTKRVYPYGSVGSQVLGIVGTDGDGLSGLEMYYDDELKGTDGEMVFEAGSGGTPIAGAASQTTEATDGHDITISLDASIQKVAEDEIAQGVKDYEADSGSVMVVDPMSGEILAACSTPLFDVTDTSEIADGALNLKSVSSSYEPGSIFKVITAAIGIEDGLVTPDSTFSVPAKVQVGSDMVGDDDGRDYTMDMSLREMLRRSSNAGMALVAQDVIGADRFAQGLKQFKIGEKTGIDYPGEVEGLVRSRSEYDVASLGSMAFGQSLAMPMVQMVRAVSSIAADGVLTTPHFLLKKGDEDASWPDQGTSVSKETADEVTSMMQTVVKEGTAQKAAVKGYDVAAKTGTGEQAGEDGTYQADSYVSSLLGFAPAEDPKVLVYVGLNGTPHLAYSSAAPLFSTIMSESLSDLGVPPTAEAGSD